jgi:hypothetical protein
MGWISPTSNNNPDSFVNPTNAYDENTGTYASKVVSPTTEVNFYLLHDALVCDKIRVNINRSAVDLHIYVWVLKDGSWVSLGEVTTPNSWVELSFTVGNVTQIRFQVDNLNETKNRTVYVNEADFWQVEAVVSKPLMDGFVLVS